MKTPIKSLIVAASVALIGATAYAQLPGGLPATNAFVAPSAGNLALRSAQLGSATGVFLQNLYLNSTLGVTNIFTGWGMGPLNVASNFDPNGGKIRIIYLGKTAGWQNDLGYVVIPPIPHGPYMPLATGIDGSNVGSGNEAIISYGAGQKVDLFINSGGPIGEGGLFYAFGLGNEYAGSDMSVHTHVNSALLPTADYGPLWTYFVGWEDERVGQQYYDADFNDLMIAIQFLPGSAVPEPSTYGIIGAVALLGLAGYRRYKAKAKVAAQA